MPIGVTNGQERLNFYRGGCTHSAVSRVGTVPSCSGFRRRPGCSSFTAPSALVTTHLEEWSDELADNRDTRGYVQVVRTPDGLFLDEQHQRLGQNAIVLHGLSGGL